MLQPGAREGQRTYCPVSGVVFAVQRASARREVDGKTIWFCCESCASYFSEHRDRIIATRGLSTPVAAP